ncbi:MAG: thiol oxidoreductase-like protein [Gemmataceae bacterium]|nr:thiol oxidoreductase-like protein [Gemmataceae bacterium]
MRRLSPTGQRRLFGLGVLGLGALVVYWNFFSDGLPIFWGPSASAAEMAAGRDLFEHEWTPNDPLAHGDGLGPVFNARSCAACHFQGGLGGGGGVEHNAVGYEVFPRPGDPTFHTGTIHNFSVDPAQKESTGTLRTLFPVIKGRTIQSGSPNCPSTTVIPEFDPVRTQSVQATALFGAGWVDLISDRAILRNARNRGVRGAVRELGLDFGGVPPGRVRRVAGGVGKFGWKAQFASLEEFVAAACANELGLGTPSTEQAKPLAAPDRSATPDLDRKQFRALVAFVKTLPKPVEAMPDLPAGREAATHGKELFATIGCATCHVPDLGGVKGVYSDFLLYTLDDPPPPGGGGGYGPEPPPQLQLASRPDDEPRPDEWKTPALWGVADSAPYLHDGSAATAHDAILRHRGDARSVSEKYRSLTPGDQAAVVSFLTTLKAPPDAPKLRDPSITKLARR